MFTRTTAVNKIMKMKARKRVIQGGTSAGKTYAIIPILIDKAIKTPKLKITVVAETIPAVKDGAVDIFAQVMQDTGRWIQSGWKSNPMEYTFTNGSRIQFKAFDSEGKAKASGKRDILFINEANHIAYLVADALMIRSKETYIDFNPNNTFWAHTEVLTEHNSEYLNLTYLDNEGIPKETLEDLLIKKSKAFYDCDLDNNKLFGQANIKNEYWANWWRVYGLGEVGRLQGVVFDNWLLVDRVPPDANYVASGMDFGFTNDPTTLVDVYNYNNQFIFNEVIYQTGLLNSDIAKRIKSDGVSRLIYADSAEPKSIEEIRRYGVRIQGAKKGKDSITYGIDLLQQHNFKVTKNSVNLIKELRGYSWDKDKTGKAINKPIDYLNHAIDAMRYFAIMKMQTNSGKYAVR